MRKIAPIKCLEIGYAGYVAWWAGESQGEASVFQEAVGEVKVEEPLSLI